MDVILKSESHNLKDLAPKHVKETKNVQHLSRFLISLDYFRNR